MDESTSISWTIEIPKKRIFNSFYNNIRSPIALIAFLSLFFILAGLIFDLQNKLQEDFKIDFISSAYLISGSILLFIIIVIAFSLKTNMLLLKGKPLNYTVNSAGIILNGNFYKWQDFKYYLPAEYTLFSDDSSKLGIIPESVNKYLSHISKNSQIKSIDLLNDRFGIKKELLLAIDDPSVYEKVLSMVSTHLKKI